MLIQHIPAGHHASGQLSYLLFLLLPGHVVALHLGRLPQRELGFLHLIGRPQ